MANSMAPHWQINASFNPWTQPITMLGPDGHTQFTFPLNEIVIVQNNVVYMAISNALQAGAALILLLTLLIITSNEKRRSLVYLLNALALLIIVLRAIVMFVAYTGPFFNFYRWQLLYYNDLGNAQDQSVTIEVLSFFLTCIIQASLALQVRIVCCTLAPLQQLAVHLLVGVVAFIVCGVRFALMVLNIFWGISGVQTETLAQFETISHLASAADITFVVGIGISTVVFCAKLALAIVSRRSIGITQFGPMQIIFIMGCQTMCTPFIVIIITYWGLPHMQAALGSVPLTVVALSLPLSAMWATANTTHRAAARERQMLHHQLPAGHIDFAKGKASETYTDTTASGTLVGDDAVSPTCSSNPRVDHNAVERDLEMQQVIHGGVQVDRSYSVRRD